MLLSNLCPSISFTGCGTLNFYQTGVAACLQEQGIDHSISFAGASAGSGLSVLLAQGTSAQEIAEVAIDILKPYRYKNILTSPKILHHFADAFLQHFITPDTLDKINDRVWISITSLSPFKNILLNQFTDQADLCKAIRASCHLPSLRKRFVHFRGKRCIDGGFTNNGPVLHSTTLRVSPFFFDRKADIKPTRKIAPWWGIIVPSEKYARQLFQEGKQDAQNFLQKITDNKITLIHKKPKDIAPFPLPQRSSFYQDYVATKDRDGGTQPPNSFSSSAATAKQR